MRKSESLIAPEVDTLGKQAEAMLETEGHAAPAMGASEFRKLFQEFRTHQIELERQNEELRRAQEELVESRDRYSDLYEFAPVGCVTINGKGLIIEANLTMAAMLDIDRRGLINQPLSNFIAPEDRDNLNMLRGNILAKNQRQTCEFRLQKKNGDRFWAKMASIPAGDAQGDTVRIRSIISEITERKLAEEALRRSEEGYRAIVTDQTEFICRFDTKGALTFVNEAYCRCCGMKAEEIIGKNFIPHIFEEDRQIVANHLVGLSRANPVRTVEHRVVMPEGEVRWQQWSGRALFDEQGNVVEYQAVGRDITDLKQAQEELQKAHTELEQRVEERTAELAAANMKMEREIQERKQTEKALLRSEAVLEKQKAVLEDTNTALKVLLEKRERDKQEFEERIVANVTKFVEPYLMKLKRSGLNERQKAFADILEQNLKEIMSPFVRTLSAMRLRLSPMETQVANFVKQGKSTKEIAELMNLSPSTIEVHRKKIRKKCGITNRKVNLRTILDSYRQ